MGSWRTYDCEVPPTMVLCRTLTVENRVLVFPSNALGEASMDLVFPSLSVLKWGNSVVLVCMGIGFSVMLRLTILPDWLYDVYSYVTFRIVGTPCPLVSITRE